MAIAVIGLHYADVAFLQPQPGTSAGDHLVSGLAPLAVLAGFAALYPIMRAGLRASAAIALGVFALGSGLVTSGWHAMDSGPSGTDFTGLLMMVGGGVLIAVGVVTLWRTRKLDRMAWRYTRRLLIAVPALVVGFQIVAGSVLGYYATHRPESSTKGAPDLGRPYEDVTLTTSDGLKLQGWYVPSRNRAAILVFPGRSGNKQRHTRSLVGHGYGVLSSTTEGRVKAKATRMCSAGTTRLT